MDVIVGARVSVIILVGVSVGARVRVGLREGVIVKMGVGVSVGDGVDVDVDGMRTVVPGACTFTTSELGMIESTLRSGMVISTLGARW